MPRIEQYPLIEIKMKKVVMTKGTHLVVTGIAGFLKRKVTKFGTGAKVDCPKEFLDKTIYLVFIDNGAKKTT